MVLNISLNMKARGLDCIDYRKSWSRNPLVILDLTSDLSFKVSGDFQGQSYTKHAISALLLPVETQYVSRDDARHFRILNFSKMAIFRNMENA